MSGASSWVPHAEGHPQFGLHNLPFGVFSEGGSAPRGGVAIGDSILDLRAALAAGLFAGPARGAAQRAAQGTLNGYFALGAPARAALREALRHLLSHASPARPDVLRPQAACQLHLPARIGDYTDFYVGIHHARNVGRLFRPDQPLLPNYQHVPIGYHGRASTVGVAPAFKRPRGQYLPAGAEAPQFGPCQRLDFELELGLWLGPGNPQGEPIGIAQAGGHLAGLCLLNDWSARDVQAWEYQPLGPFLSKSFATSVSPWVVTAEALAPYRRAQPPRPAGAAQPLAYLWDEHDQAHGAWNIELQVLLRTARMRAEHQPDHLLAQSNTLNMYWTAAQLIAHHSSNGCALNPGDLFGSGTLSGPGPGSLGSLLELTAGGREPVRLPNGETRLFLEDGDEVTLRARCLAEGLPPLGFGECRGRVLPS
ncbi:fumarylacetoacetase [Pseudomonas sp. NPDC007930]|uniref:fumarylacetoacetase n=1 Tax=Pseudomonas sp. NPDC007930 TaxID=3364417 RepID=UPI0036ECA07C